MKPEITADIEVLVQYVANNFNPSEPKVLAAAGRVEAWLSTYDPEKI